MTQRWTPEDDPAFMSPLADVIFLSWDNRSGALGDGIGVFTSSLSLSSVPFNPRSLLKCRELSNTSSMRVRTEVGLFAQITYNQKL